MAAVGIFMRGSHGMKRELYQWQEECLKRWYANHGRGMVQAVTGSGKTLLALTAAERLEKELRRPLRVKIVVPTGTLMHQWNRAIREFLAESRREYADENLRGIIGLRGGGYKDSANCRYMIYVINSARYELARQILSELKEGEAVFLIADECHHYESGQNQLIFEFLPYIKPYEPSFFSMGLSATLPSGQAGKYLASVLGRRIYSYGMRKALEMRTVCPYDIYHIGLSFQREERDEYRELSEHMSVLNGKLIQMYPVLKNMNQKERFEMLRRLAGDKNRKTAETASRYMNLVYRRKNLVCLASMRIACALDLTERLGLDEKIIIFGERISQAEELYRFLQERYPGRAGRYHSGMGAQANKNVLERFRVGEIRILVACKAIDEGMDVPDAATGIILSGTSTQRQRVQRLGRVIRKKENAGRASLYYLHITETSEDSCYLPDVKGNRILELEYSFDEREFYNPAYEKKAEQVLDRLRSKGVDAGKIKEAERCLRRGRVRSDWLLQDEEIMERIQSAKHTGDRNYWICMRCFKA